MAVEKTVLPNGLRVLSETMPHLETAALGVWVNVGGRNEGEGEHGISHLLEHMAFKGTRRRTAKVIAEEIESVGGDLNAATSSEQTAYYARVLREDVPLAVDILGDILQNSTFDADELDREQHVIVQEIGAAHDTPDDVVFDHFQEAAFPGQPLGRSILGTPETVRGFRPPHLDHYLKSLYTGPGMILAAAGAVSHDELVELAQRHLGGIAPKAAEPAVPAQYNGGEARLERDLEQVHLVLGFNGMPYSHEDFYAAQLLASVLGGGMSSRLFQEVREKRGLCYSVSAFHWSYRDAGLFGVYAATGEQNLAELIPVVTGELGRIADDAGEAELARAKAQFKAGLMMGLESCSARAERMARHELLFGRVMTPTETRAKIDAVTSDDLKRVAGKLFRAGGLTLSAIGPLRFLAAHDKISSGLN